MKILDLLFAALLVAGCCEKAPPEDSASTGETSATSNEGAPVDSPSPEIAELPPLPETITREFIMRLWEKPHDARNLIKELEGFGAPGVWKTAQERGPRKGEWTRDIPDSDLQDEFRETFLSKPKNLPKKN